MSVDKPAIQLTEQQLSAVDMVRENKFSVLTGGPGTGKTTTVREVIFWAFLEHLHYALCAPTGKAAKRISETTDCPASTIHSLLGPTMGADGEFTFAYGLDMKLNLDLLIVDETSMVPNQLMADLLRAVDPDQTKVLLVGDQGQLPSVGAGAVLRDILASGVVPHVELTQIHRNSGDIVKACHKIHQGQSYVPSEALDPAAGMNLRHIELQHPEEIRDAIAEIVTKRMPARGYDPVWDVQVISPVNSKSILSCDGMNQVLQAALNPSPPVGGGDDGKSKSIFRLNDKVIQTKNETIDNDYVVNGDMGKVLDDFGGSSSKMQVQFFSPDRFVNISQKANNLLLAYCITCHRMQGSEAPVVIIPVHKSFGYFVTRSWIYTAISRAKDICVTVGQFDAIARAVGRQDAVVRKTMLKEKLCEAWMEKELEAV